MKKILIIFFCFITVPAQDFKLGFDIKAHQIRVSDQEGNHILGGDGFPLAIHLNFAYSPSNKIAILTKIGRTFHIEFLGWEFELSGKYNFYKSLYISAGLMQHSNEGGSGSNSHGTKYASILMLKGGIGFDISSITSIELDYYIPTTKKIIGGQRGFNSSGKETFFTHTFKSMIRLGFVFAWEL